MSDRLREKELCEWLKWLRDEPVALTCDDLERLGSLEHAENNTLSWLGNRVSHYLRRALLLRELEAARWNMADVSRRLRLGYGSSPTLRAIRELGLTPEYETAKAAGKIKHGGSTKREALR